MLQLRTGDTGKRGKEIEIMTVNTIRIVNDHQEKLLVEASHRRTLATLDQPSLRQRLATVASLVRAAFPGLDVAQGSVFPATH
jgi:hypothetical protein